MNQVNKMLGAHATFLDSISQLVLGEVLVGTLAYATNNNLSPKSDIDSMVIIKRKSLETILESKFLKGIIDSEVAMNALNTKIADSLV